MWIKLPNNFQLNSSNKTELDIIHWNEMILTILNWNIYNLYQQRKKIINQYKESREPKWDNCHRIQKNNSNTFYCINFVDKRSDTIDSCKFKHVKVFSGKNQRINCLCNEYHDSNINDEVDWCSFIWGLLSNNNTNEQYGDAVWRFIPSEWSNWWLSSLQIKCPSVFKHHTLNAFSCMQW